MSQDLDWFETGGEREDDGWWGMAVSNELGLVGLVSVKFQIPPATRPTHIGCRSRKPITGSLFAQFESISFQVVLNQTVSLGYQLAWTILERMMNWITIIPLSQKKKKNHLKYSDVCITKIILKKTYYRNRWFYLSCNK